MTDPVKTVTVLTACTALKSAAEEAAAEALYRGQHHLRLMRGVGQAREAGIDVQLWIVSAGYGVVAGHKRLRPYERTFQGMSATDRRSSARALPTSCAG